MVETRGRGEAEQPSALAVLWRARWLIALGFVVGALAGYVVSQQQPVRYTAQSRLVLGSSSNFSPLGDSGYIEPSRYVANQISILTSSPVLERAIRLLDPGTSAEDLRVALEELEESVDATAAGDSDVITIRSTAPTAALAKQRADALATAYRNFVGQQVESQTQRAIASTDDPTRIATIQAQAALYGDGVAVFEPAQRPVRPSAPSPRRNALVLGAGGALLAAAWALMRRSQTRVQTSWQASANTLGVPVVGAVAAEVLTEPLSIVRDDGQTANARSAFETMLVGLSYVGGGGADTVMLTGKMPSGRVSSAARALAVAASNQGRRVLLLDVETGEGRETVQGGLLGPLPSATLSPVVVESVDGQVVRRRLHDVRSEDGEALRVLHLTGKQGRRALERLRDGADLVVLGAPSVTTSALGFALAGIVDAVLLLVDDETTGEDVTLAEERVHHVGGRLVGLIEISPRSRWRRSVDRKPPRELPERGAGSNVEASREPDDVKA